MCRRSCSGGGGGPCLLARCYAPGGWLACVPASVRVVARASIRISPCLLLASSVRMFFPAALDTQTPRHRPAAHTRLHADDMNILSVAQWPAAWRHARRSLLRAQPRLFACPTLAGSLIPRCAVPSPSVHQQSQQDPEASEGPEGWQAEAAVPVRPAHPGHARLRVDAPGSQAAQGRGPERVARRSAAEEKGRERAGREKNAHW